MKIGIVGCGFSGLMTAYHLLAHGGGEIEVTVFDREFETFGAAYSTNSPSHRLNVRAKGMSAFPGSPDDFISWIERTGRAVDRNEFVPRSFYRSYLTNIKEELNSRFGDRCRWIIGEVVDGEIKDSGILLRLHNSSEYIFDKIVLALGEGKPRSLKGIDPRIIQDPWAYGPLEQVSTEKRGTEKRVILIGTGLTAVDIALSLEDSGHTGPITMISRHGLLPAIHEPVQSYKNDGLPPPWKVTSLKEMWLNLREHIERAASWQSVFEWIRPNIQEMWKNLPPEDQSTFIKRLLPFWNIHRHRMPTQVGNRINNLRESGKLQITHGEVKRIKDVGKEISVELNNEKEIRTDFVINCTGPNLYRDGSSSLLNSLFEKKLIAVGFHGLGIRANEFGAAIDPTGKIGQRIFATGGLLRGELFEITAVPDLRAQALKTAVAVLRS